MRVPNHKYIFLIFLLSMLHAEISFSQTKNKNYIINADYGSGFILPHHSFFNYYFIKHPYSLNLTIGKQVDGSKKWHKKYRMPVKGFGMHYTSLGTGDYLGNATAVYGFMNIPVIKKKKFSFNYTIAAGYSFLTERFNIDNNYMNIAIGSKGNVYFNLDIDSKYKIYNKLNLKLALGITHYSNGAFAKPNTGINVIALKTGLVYAIKETEIKNDTSFNKFKKYNNLRITACSGVREVSTSFNDKYFISSISIDFQRAFWFKRKLGIGFDAFYDNSIVPQLERDSIISNGTSDNFRLGLHFGHDLVIGKTAIIMQIGLYAFDKLNKDGMLYNRFGVQQNIYKELFVNISLKTHYFKADFIEWGIGYNIK